jgi:hypothetical protein
MVDRVKLRPRAPDGRALLVAVHGAGARHFMRVPDALMIGAQAVEVEKEHDHNRGAVRGIRDSERLQESLVSLRGIPDDIRAVLTAARGVSRR